MPPSKDPLHDTFVVTPPSSPIAEVTLPCASSEANTTEQMPDTAASEVLQHSAPGPESGDGPEDGEVVEEEPVRVPKGSNEAAHDEHEPAAPSTEKENVIATTSILGDGIASENTSSKPTPPSEDACAKAGNEDNKIDAHTTNKVCTFKAKGSADATERAATLAMKKNSDMSGQHEDVKDVHNSSMKIQAEGATSGISEDETFGDDEDTAVETQTPNSDSLSAVPRSGPPHMRPSFKPPNVQHPSSQEGRRDWSAPAPRAPRRYYPPTGYQPSRPPIDYDELQRTKVQLIKARSDLEVERGANMEMRKTVGAEKQASIGAAMSDMLTNLLQKQAEALEVKAKAQEKERELFHREKKIAQLEEYLSDGQRQLKYQLEQQGIRLMSTVDQANLRREVELKVRHQISDIEGKIAIQVERLRLQEAAQKIREQQYKTLVRDDLEAEIREQIAQDDRVRTVNTEATGAAYRRGLVEGKQAEGAQVPESALKQEFLKGYAACYRFQTVLHNMRTGRIVADSSGLAFLHDPTHPENPLNVGLQIGRLEVAPKKVATSTAGVVISRQAMEEGAARASAITGEVSASSTTVTIRGRGRADYNDASPTRSTQTANWVGLEEYAHQAQQTQRSQPPQLPQQVQKEEPARSSIPLRPTFAGELRGSSSGTPSGTFASRNNPQPVPNSSRAAATPPGSGTTRVGVASHMGEGVYAGRRTIRYEHDPEDEPASPNLIDLY